VNRFTKTQLRRRRRRRITLTIKLVTRAKLGYVHTPESIEKLRSLALCRKHNDQVKKLMSESRKGINNNFIHACMHACLLRQPAR
jgi:hypothetical protein